MLERLMATVFTRIAALLSDKWTGEITIRLSINQGGIRDARFSIDEGILK